jgi:hypothetical protein
MNVTHRARPQAMLREQLMCEFTVVRGMVMKSTDRALFADRPKSAREGHQSCKSQSNLSALDTDPQCAEARASRPSPRHTAPEYSCGHVGIASGRAAAEKNLQVSPSISMKCVTSRACGLLCAQYRTLEIDSSSALRWSAKVGKCSRGRYRRDVRVSVPRSTLPVP